MTARNSVTAHECAPHHNGGSDTAGGAAAASPTGQRRCTDVGFQIEDDLFRARSLNDLAHWIGKAKHLIAEVVRAVDRDETILDRFKARGVGVYDAEWHDHHADGLEVLHMTINDHLRAVRQIAGIESSEATGT